MPSPTFPGRGIVGRCSNHKHTNHTLLLPCDRMDCRSETPETDLLSFAFSVEEKPQILELTGSKKIHVRICTFLSINRLLLCANGYQSTDTYICQM